MENWIDDPRRPLKMLLCPLSLRDVLHGGEDSQPGAMPTQGHFTHHADVPLLSVGQTDPMLQLPPGTISSECTAEEAPKAPDRKTPDDEELVLVGAAIVYATRFGGASYSGEDAPLTPAQQQLSQLLDKPLRPKGERTRLKRG